MDHDHTTDYAMISQGPDQRDADDLLAARGLEPIS